MFCGEKHLPVRLRGWHCDLMPALNSGTYRSFVESFPGGVDVFSAVFGHNRVVVAGVGSLLAGADMQTAGWLMADM